MTPLPRFRHLTESGHRLLPSDSPVSTPIDAVDSADERPMHRNAGLHSRQRGSGLADALRDVLPVAPPPSLAGPVEVCDVGVQVVELELG
ncbi:hypothetical protein BOX15_Mlig009550g2 [Macrostomum lignano]|uniref:Uncharacterized protein n=1 Tax=Macrostomum lignano TaxID=282301 RepID=A0A267DRR2_9PLAT|nr:hypothetical protein BOX15_Mlig009550g2 [Macrostomum lignano]